MRTEQRWFDCIYPKELRHYFSSRIQKDLQTIPDTNPIKEVENFFIHGPTQSGKTLLSARLLLQERKQIYLEGGPKNAYDICVFISMDNLIRSIKSVYEKTNEMTETEIIAYYSNVRLLVIDDFGTVKTTDWVLSILYSIINNRYEGLKKTIINSNLSLNEIAKSLGDDRITSRIERMCKVIRKKKF